MPPAIFASTVNRAVFDLPWLDFAWFFPRRPHKLRTPPWSKLQPSLVAAGGSVTWESKIELAMHTGNVGSPYRKTLSEVARVNPETILVNELFIGDHFVEFFSGIVDSVAIVRVNDENDTLSVGVIMSP